MKVKQLIKELQKLEEMDGNIPVYLYNPYVDGYIEIDHTCHSRLLEHEKCPNHLAAPISSKDREDEKRQFVIIIK